MTTQQPVVTQTGYGYVKQVISGDQILIRGPPKGGPPKEKTIVLTGITAPKLARRPTEKSEATKDQPYAWEAREFLRKKLIGKRVFFTYEKSEKCKSSVEKSSLQDREFGIVYNGTDATAENVTESLVSEGLVDVRRQARNNEFVAKLIDLEEAAKANNKGKHGPKANDHVRDVRWTIDNPQTFKDSLHQKPVKAIVEHVVDGSTLRVLLYSQDFPEYYYIKLMLSGIRCNAISDDSYKDPEPYAIEAKYFTESRLLQRDVDVILESVSNKNFLGTVLHPKGNITEFLLTEGYAKCVDWSLQCVSSGIDKLRAAEKQAKERRLRIWKDYAPSGPTISAKEREFQGKVIEVINADAMNVKLADGSVKKIFLASIRPPRLAPEDTKQRDQKDRPLYSIPYMFEAREFLRKKLIGKKVNVTIDYKQPARDQFPEKICCTVTIGGINVAEALVSKGLANVVKYRADDDQRSAHYDELLSAETKAQKSLKGVHSKKEERDTHVVRNVDLTQDLKSSKQYFPLIQRAGKIDALVEFVSSGSRLRLFLPRQNYLITFLLGGISCARVSRDNTATPSDPHGDDALSYTKDLVMQKEVQVEVDSMDKFGSFIGWLWIDNVNLSESLLKEGFAEIHTISASRSPHFRALQAAQEQAQKKKLRIWENYEPAQHEVKEDTSDRTVNLKTVSITETKEESLELAFYAQHFDEGPKLDILMEELREEFENSPPYPGNYTPTKNDLCAAVFPEDDQWYRAKVIKNVKGGVYVSFIDYGNKETVLPSKLAALPAKYKSPPPYAHEYALAFIKLPKDVENARDARIAFWHETQTNGLKLNLEYRNGSTSYVTLFTSDEKDDIGKKLIEKGFLLVEPRKEKKFHKIMSEYKSAQDIAKKNRANLWVYGDITEDDAKEFG